MAVDLSRYKVGDKLTVTMRHGGVYKVEVRIARHESMVYLGPLAHRESATPDYWWFRFNGRFDGEPIGYPSAIIAVKSNRDIVKSTKVNKYLLLDKVSS